MLFRCTNTFETMEGGVPRTVDEGGVWFKLRHVHVAGGYECADLEQVRDGVFTGDVARVRLSRLSDDFETIPLKDVSTHLMQ